MELNKDDLNDTVLRLVMLAAEQRASIDSLTSALFKILERVVSEEEDLEVEKKKLATWIDEKKAEKVVDIHISMEGEHPELATIISEMHDQANEYRNRT